jgi:hypothetical protein
MVKNRLDWHPQLAIKKVGKKIKNAVLAICLDTVIEIKTSMKSYGQYSILSTKQTVPGYMRQRKGRRIRHFPAPPEHPPAVDTGRLRGSISYNWSGSGKARGKTDPPATDADGVGQYQLEAPTDIGFVATIGTNVKYACVFGSHNILTKKGLKRISKLKVDEDEVLTQTGEYRKVKAVHCRKAEEVPNLITIETNYRKGKNHHLTVTEEHKFLVNRDGINKWIKAKDLKETDFLYSRKKPALLPNVRYIVHNNSMNSYVNLDVFKTVEIKKITKHKYEQIGDKSAMVWDITVEDVHSYYVNGLLVSNSYLEFGTRKMLPRPFIRPIYMILKLKMKAFCSQFSHGAKFPTVKPRW